MKNSEILVESKYFPNLVKRVRYLKETNEGEKYMCEIMDGLIKEALKEHEKNIVITTLRKLEFTPDAICNHLILEFNISEEIARLYIKTHLSIYS